MLFIQVSPNHWDLGLQHAEFLVTETEIEGGAQLEEYSLKKLIKQLCFSFSFKLDVAVLH